MHSQVAGGKGVSATGRCLCGNVTYALAQAPVAIDVCHCKNCQRQAGAAFIPFVAVPLSDLSVTGQPKVFVDNDTVSGNPVERHFCGDCGSPIYVVVDRAPNTAYVTSGTLDKTEGLRPKCHGWTGTKHDWVSIVDGAPEYEADPGLQPEGV